MPTRPLFTASDLDASRTRPAGVRYRLISRSCMACAWVGQPVPNLARLASTARIPGPRPRRPRTILLLEPPACWCCAASHHTSHITHGPGDGEGAPKDCPPQQCLQDCAPAPRHGDYLAVDCCGTLRPFFALLAINRGHGIPQLRGARSPHLYLQYISREPAGSPDGGVSPGNFNKPLPPALGDAASPHRGRTRGLADTD